MEFSNFDFDFDADFDLDWPLCFNERGMTEMATFFDFGFCVMEELLCWLTVLTSCIF